MSDQDNNPRNQIPEAVHDTMRAQGLIHNQRLAALLGVNRSTVLRWLEEGAVSGVDLGSRRFVSLADAVKHYGAQGCNMLGAGPKLVALGWDPGAVRALGLDAAGAVPAVRAAPPVEDDPLPLE